MKSDAIPHLRSLLRLAESAQKAGDDELVRTALAATEVLARDNSPIDLVPALAYMRALVSRCDHCYMVAGEDELAALRDRVIQKLARHNESLIAANAQKALRLPPMIQLVTAMYIRKKNNKTEGVSVALIVDENEEVQFPRKGLLIGELQTYLHKTSLWPSNPSAWMPNELGEYRLMAGSIEMQEVLPEELPEMSW